MLHDHDQQHLLSPSMSSPGLSSGHPSPLKPLHLVTYEQNHAYHHEQTFEDYENLKDATHEDAVRAKHRKHSCKD
jgi:hypothetical protein